MFLQTSAHENLEEARQRVEQQVLKRTHAIRKKLESEIEQLRV